MKEEIKNFIIHFAQEKDKGGLIPGIWREPLVAFGDATQGEIAQLRQLVHPEHVLPREILPTGKTIIAYFFPFTKDIGNSNKGGRFSSREWAMAYEKTNAALGDLATALIAYLAEKGAQAAVTPEATRYDEKLLKSKWSQRHIAYFCGLGTLGKNNMLITQAGCCGRIGTIVTDLELTPDPLIKEEYCLYKQDSNTCGACIQRCPSQALTPEGYDRKLCNNLCAENANLHIGYGSSYTLDQADQAIVGTNTCGKCVVGLPCTYRKP